MERVLPEAVEAVGNCRVVAPAGLVVLAALLVVVKVQAPGTRKLSGAAGLVVADQVFPVATLSTVVPEAVARLALAVAVVVSVCMAVLEGPVATVAHQPLGLPLPEVAGVAATATTVLTVPVAK